MSGEPVLCRGDFSTKRAEAINAAAIALLNAKCGRIDRAGRPDTSALLAKVVEGEIIPRLMQAHKPEADLRPQAATDTLAARLSSRHVDAFTFMVLSNEVDDLLAHVRELLQSGLSADGGYFEFLCASARRLGDYWNDDRISLAEVTIGLGRLQQLIRMLSLKPQDDLGEGGGERSAFFASCPGEQHSFGVALVDDFFHRAGWKTCVEPSASCEQIAFAVGHQWFDLFGLNASSSVCCKDQIEVMASTITSARRVSRNRHMTVIVGGRLFHEQPELAAYVGADAMASGDSVAMLTV